MTFCVIFWQSIGMHTHYAPPHYLDWTSGAPLFQVLLSLLGLIPEPQV